MIQIDDEAIEVWGGTFYLLPIAVRGEVIRLISARPVTRRETERYYEEVNI